MSGCGREDRFADGMYATCGHHIHGPQAPAFVCRDCLTADRDRLAAELARVRSASESLASLIRLRYPRLLERGNPLYDATLDAALAQPQDGTTEGQA